MSRRCEQDGCRKQPSFGYPGGRPVRCATHRLEKMVGTLQACHGKSELLPRLRVHTSLLHRSCKHGCLAARSCPFSGEAERKMRRCWLP